MSFGIYAIQFYIQSSLPLLRHFLLVSLCYITISKGMRNIHLHIFFNDLVKRRLRHSVNIFQRRMQISPPPALILLDAQSSIDHIPTDRKFQRNTCPRPIL